MPPPVSMKLAMSFAGTPVCSSEPPTPTSRPGSVAAARAELYAQGLAPARSDVSIYKDVFNHSLGWKRRKTDGKLRLAREKELSVMRWDGRNRMASPWDGLWRDQELWYPHGDCLIHLYSAGTSRRGPAFRIPFEYLLRSDCGPLLTRHLAGYSSTDSSPLSSGSEDASYFNLPVMPHNRRYDLYILAPPASRNQSLRQHILTRNFFAWICMKPLVGENLGTALIDLLESMHEYRSDGADNVEDLMSYMHEMGYSDMADAPEHAIAMLILSERIHDEGLWAVAYKHVVGMWEACAECDGYSALSGVTRSLVMRGHYALMLRLQDVSTSLATFLDEQLGTQHISLSAQNAEHLKRFREFLHTYWISVLGYYPPTSTTSEGVRFSKGLLYGMRKQFQALFDYLVDWKWRAGDPSPEGAGGGLCVLEAVQAFDLCGRYESLEYPLPHLPEVKKEVKEKKSLVSLVGKKDKLHVDPRLASLSTLSKASNAGRPELLQSSLVKAFRLFEKQSVWADAKEREKTKKKALSNEEGEKRKVRWILIYGIVQTLRTVTEVDECVKDVDRNVDYFLYSEAPEAPWLAERRKLETEAAVEKKRSASSTVLMHIPSNSSSNSSSNTAYTAAPTSTRPTTAESSPIEPKMNIEPDIDHVALSRRNSRATNAPAVPLTQPIAMRPYRRPSMSLHLPTRASLKLRTQSLPTSDTTRISPTSPARAKGTITRALSSLGNMPKLQQPKPVRPNGAILVAGYGNGTCEVAVGWLGQEELHALKRSSVSSGESSNYDCDKDEDEEEIEGHVQSPLVPAHGYEDCLSGHSSEEDEEIFDKTHAQSPSTATSLSRSGSDSSGAGEKEKPLTAGPTAIEVKPLPTAHIEDRTPRSSNGERRKSEVVYKQLGNRMTKIYAAVNDEDLSSDQEREDDEVDEIGFGKKGRKREMLTLMEALTLDARV